MKKSEAVKFFGSISKLAKALDITYEAVRQWPENGVPMLRQYEIMILSNGVLTAQKPDKEPCQSGSPQVIISTAGQQVSVA